jgi:hypothetical protein
MDHAGAWHNFTQTHQTHVGDMPESPSSQYGLKAQEDIDPKRD